MAIIMSDINTTIKGTASAIITLFSLHQTINNPNACWAFIIAAIIMGVAACFFYRKNKLEAIVAFISAGIMILFSSCGLYHDQRLKKDEGAWLVFLNTRSEDRIAALKRKADSGDGPSQLELSTEYYQHADYGNALGYAQKAADNGSAEACTRVALFKIFGMGCIADVQQGITYLIRAQKFGNYSFDSIYKEITDNGIVLSDTDRMRMDQSNQIQIRLEEINSLLEDAYDNKGNSATISLFQQLYEEIKQYSLEGYISAIEMLYFGEFLIAPNGSQELKRLANQLYQANHIPTAPIDRGYFFQLVHNDDISYDSKKYKQYIKDNNYYYLGFVDLLDKDASTVYEKYSNKYLIEEYELYKAQYEWFISLKEDKNLQTNYVFRLHTIDYDKYVILAEALLRQNINGIKLRMEHPELGSSEDEDWLIGRSFKVTFANPRT